MKAGPWHLYSQRDEFGGRRKGHRNYLRQQRKFISASRQNLRSGDCALAEAPIAASRTDRYFAHSRIASIV
jgi:hypothetical protein